MIEIQQVKYGYNKSKLLFDTLGFGLGEGQICGLFGNNGVGKTTLLELISGLRFPMEGNISFQGMDVSTRDVKTLSDIYFVSEEFDLPNMNSRQFEKLYAGLYPKFNSALFHQNLAAFKMLSDSSLSKMSMGERKKFLISFALATGCSLILMDEPTNGLDIPSKSIFRKVVLSSISETQTFIISTHQVNDLEKILDHLIILKNGKVVLNESTLAIQQKFSPIPKPEAALMESVVFEEPGLGPALVVRNETEDNMDFPDLNLELLFNAVQENPEAINQHLTK